MTRPPITQRNYPLLIVYKGWFYWWTSSGNPKSKTTADQWWASQNLDTPMTDKIGPFASRKLLKFELDRRAA